MLPCCERMIGNTSAGLQLCGALCGQGVDQPMLQVGWFGDSITRSGVRSLSSGWCCTGHGFKHDCWHVATKLLQSMLSVHTHTGNVNSSRMLPAHRRDLWLRLAISTILSARQDRFLLVAGPVCGSFVTANSGTHGRTLSDPIGRDHFPSVRMGNLLACRSLGCKLRVP